MTKITSLKTIRNLLKESHNPLYFYDYDTDGLVSYLLLRRGFEKGNGVIIRVRGMHLDENELYLNKINEYNPDLVVFLDKPTLNQDIFDKINVKKIWIDHHEVADVKGVYYYNPRIKNKKDNKPTSYICYKISGKDLWLAGVGTVADWSLSLFKNFKKEYPELVDKIDLKNLKADDIIYGTRLGDLVRVFSFILKGKTFDVKKNIEMLLKINSPYDILEGKSKEGKRLLESADKFRKKYHFLLNEAIDENKKSKRLVVFTYLADNASFTSDLANELIHKFPGKVVVVGRIKDEQMRVSLRSSENDIELPAIIHKICGEMKCSGGGHEHAAAVEIHKDDFEKFIRLVRGFA